MLSKEIIVQAVQMFSRTLDILILVRIILSWIPGLNSSFIGRIVFTLTEPILGPIRRLIAKSPLGGPGMMLDFSPIIAYFAIEIVTSLVISLIVSF